VTGASPGARTPWVRTPEALASVLRSLDGTRAVALDSESDSLHHHFEKVCLVQLAAGRESAWLVDPLAFRDLSPLAALVADPSVLKVFHGADYDVTTMKRDFGFAFVSLFDTMIAARFLGLPEIGLQALARTELGVALSKDNQKDDWSRRPLSASQEEYALADVRHLLDLQARLEARLRERGRLEWVREECDAVAALPAARRETDLGAYLRIKGAARLRPRGLAALRELVAWREARAASSDTPAFKVLSNEVLLALAERSPRTREELSAVRGVLPRLDREAEPLLAALRRGRELPDSELPAFPRVARPVVPEAVRRRVDALKAWRAEKAKTLALDVSVVLPQRLIDKVAERAPRDIDGLRAIEGLRRWRIEEFGAALIAVLVRG
jgi:ribonuclease D